MAIGRPDSPPLWGLVVRAAWRRARRRLRAGPVYRWRYTGRTPERVLIAPPDLRLPDKQIADEIYHGRYPLAGHMIDTGGQSPFQIEFADVAWLRSLHGFRWLRHMREAGTELAAANARALVTDWMTTHGRRIAGIAWEPAVTARRVIAWLQHSTVVLQGADLAFYRAYLRSLAVQIRYLRAMAPEMPDGEERLRARAALAYSALSLPASRTALRAATRHLASELERQILPDGGHVSRSPLALIELLADLLPLRHTYANQAEAPPDALIAAVERMLPALRFFRHQDGALALFNGMGATVQDRVAAILHHDDTGGQPLANAPHSGYQRLASGGTTVIADTGAPPPAEVSHRAHAGCLSFEMSSGRQRFIVNCGIDEFGDDEFLPLARATAAHSTATLNDTSQARFAIAPRLAELIGTPLVGGPRKVAVRRTDSSGAQGFVASHDGYLHRFGLTHERELLLSPDGGMLEGADRFYGPGGARPAANGRDEVAVRFHVHPAVGIFRDRQERMVLKGPAGDLWLFTCAEVPAVVEDSIFFAGIGGPQKSRQIVLSFRASEFPEINWRFARVHA
ncbi:MAG: heparinase II/III family protein [Rhizobiales bacterium]|nr:heparinase II/III family protein [Hyphomicrobiales bacterium]